METENNDNFGEDRELNSSKDDDKTAEILIK